MADGFDNRKEPMLEIFIYETNELLQQLEEILLRTENNNAMSREDINEIFRIMHTIKGSADMMNFHNIASVTHAVEDLFDFLRRNPDVDFSPVVDIGLLSLDFVKDETCKIQEGKKPDGDEKSLRRKINRLLKKLDANKSELLPGDISLGTENARLEHYLGFEAKSGTEHFQKYKAKIFFEDGCQMENIHAFSFVFNLKEICGELYYSPPDIADNNDTADSIIKNGFRIYFSSDSSPIEIEEAFRQILFLKSYELHAVEEFEEEITEIIKEVGGKDKGNNQEEDLPVEGQACHIINTENNTPDNPVFEKSIKQSMISVNTGKLDRLLDLVGEIVTAESMVTKNPDLEGLNLQNFQRASRQLKKLLEELQDTVMSIRMVPLSETFHKMYRIVRDMGKRLGKQVELQICGEETEVDKNIIVHLADPLMHLIRNSMDHGIETPEERTKLGKPAKGRIAITAANAGGEVMITVGDNGKGLNKSAILEQARKKGLVHKAEEELTDKEIFSFILYPGFSTKEEVTEFSGRGVGMDVVKENIGKIGGNLVVESEEGNGTAVTIRIPLTLAIINGMKIGVGESVYTIPTVSVREFFKAEKKSVVVDTDGNEMIMLRGNCYPIVRLHKKFHTQTDVTDLCDGIMVMAEWDGKVICLFADTLIDEQSVVVRPLPDFLNRFASAAGGIGGCTILGDGSISLILDVKSMIEQII